MDAGKTDPRDGNRTTRVLLVEDNAVAAKVVVAVLERAEKRTYAVDHALDLHSAAERLCCTAYDVVVLDLNLPDSQGMSTLSEVRDLAKAPIIVLTGDDDADLGEAALSAGAQDFLVKGKYDQAALERSIRYAVQRHRIESENRKVIAELVDASVRYERALRELERLNETLKLESASRQKASAALRESEARHRLLFDEAPVPLWEVDFSRVKALFDKIASRGTDDLETYFRLHASEIVHCFRLARTLGINKAAVELYEAADKQDLAERFIVTFTDESFGAFIEGLIALAGGRRRFEQETTLQSLAGRDIHVAVRWSVAPGAENDLSRVLYSTVDITERKRAESERALLVAAIDQLTESVVVLSTAGEIVYTNPAFEKTTGRSRTEVHGQALRGFFAADKMGEGFYDGLDKRLRGGETWRGRVACRRKDGTAYDAEVAISPVRSPSGEITNFVSVGRDVTHEVALERQLAQAQKMEAIGQLAAGIAHEINTPTQYFGDNTRFFLEAFQAFSGAIGDLEKLRDGGPASASEVFAAFDRSAEERDLAYFRAEVPAALAQTSEGVERIAAIVAAMKEFAHPGTAERQAFDLNHGIQSTVTVARNEWKYVAEVQLDLDASLPLVPCFPGEVNQVILNLVVNAAHAIAAKRGEGGDKGVISISTRSERGNAVVRVADDGCGMTDEIRSRIFDPFFTTKEVGKGSGQGLFIAYTTIVEKHGGDIEVVSEPGAGTTFVIKLPLASSRLNGAERGGNGSA